jgi:hypothetical protein
MDEQDVRERAEALCAAAVAGDIDRVIEDFSPELRHNLGEVLALLPLPSDSATVERIERGGGSGYTALEGARRSYHAHRGEPPEQDGEGGPGRRRRARDGR